MKKEWRVGHNTIRVNGTVVSIEYKTDGTRVIEIMPEDIEEFILVLIRVGAIVNPHGRKE